jgi:hypothetical protein
MSAWDNLKMLALDGAQPTHKIVIELIDDDNSLLKLLQDIKQCSDPGHSFNVVVDPGDPGETHVNIDGDGAFRIVSIKGAGY